MIFDSVISDTIVIGIQFYLPACRTWWRRWRCPGCHNWHTVQVFKVNVIIVRFRFWIPIRGQCQLLSAIPERNQEDKILGVVISRVMKIDMVNSVTLENSMNQLLKSAMIMECNLLLEMCLAVFRRVIWKIWFLHGKKTWHNQRHCWELIARI